MKSKTPNHPPIIVLTVHTLPTRLHTSKECQNINTVNSHKQNTSSPNRFTIEVFCFIRSLHHSIIITHPRSQLLNPFPYPRNSRINTLVILLIRSQRRRPPPRLPRRRTPSSSSSSSQSRPRNIHFCNFGRISIILGRRNNTVQRTLTSCLSNLCPTVHFVV